MTWPCSRDVKLFRKLSCNNSCTSVPISIVLEPLSWPLNLSLRTAFLMQNNVDTMEVPETSTSGLTTTKPFKSLMTIFLFSLGVSFTHRTLSISPVLILVSNQEACRMHSLSLPSITSWILNLISQRLCSTLRTTCLPYEAHSAFLEQRCTTKYRDRMKNVSACIWTLYLDSVLFTDFDLGLVSSSSMIVWVGVVTLPFSGDLILVKLFELVGVDSWRWLGGSNMSNFCCFGGSFSTSGLRPRLFFSAWSFSAGGLCTFDAFLSKLPEIKIFKLLWKVRESKFFWASLVNRIKFTCNQTCRWGHQ